MSRRPLISVVDDNSSLRESLKGLLKSLGHAVEIFTSAESFLESSALPKTKCLILDVRMPGMTGPELQQELMSRQIDIPIIFITAHEYDRSHSGGLEDRAVAWLRKPFREEALLAAIDQALKK